VIVECVRLGEEPLGLTREPHRVSVLAAGGQRPRSDSAPYVLGVDVGRMEPLSLRFPSQLVRLDEPALPADRKRQHVSRDVDQGPGVRPKEPFVVDAGQLLGLSVVAGKHLDVPALLNGKGARHRPAQIVGDPLALRVQRAGHVEVPSHRNQGCLMGHHVGS